MSKPSTMTASARRSTPAMEQRAASVVTDFSRKNNLRFSNLHLQEYSGELHVHYALSPRIPIESEEFHRIAKELEHRLVFLLSESSGFVVRIHCRIEFGYIIGENELFGNSSRSDHDAAE